MNEPYFNEAGYERQKGTQQGRENSRMYNEMAVLKLVQSMNRLIQNPPELFAREIHEHFQSHAGTLIARYVCFTVCRTVQLPYSTVQHTHCQVCVLYCMQNSTVTL